MIKIYADQIKNPDIHYIEDDYSSYEIINMEMDEFQNMIGDYIDEWGDIHTCYSTFVNHVGRFVREHGKTWYGDEFVVVGRKYVGLSESGNKVYINVEHYFNEKGQLKDWPFGYFG